MVFNFKGFNMSKLFSNKKASVNIVTFADELESIKSIFKEAHENANNLHSRMEEEIKNKEAKILSLQSDIVTINTTKKETEKFLDNIAKLI